MSPSSSTYTPEKFFSAWKTVCYRHQTKILDKWDERSAYTELVVWNHPPGLVFEVAQELRPDGSLCCHCEYYSIDAIFFHKEDTVICRPDGSTWVQNIRIAFEHEQAFTSGLYQETSHLLMTRADLRVLVTYPEKHAIEPEFAKLEKVLANSGLADPAFLLITGQRGMDEGADVIWCAYTFKDGKLQEMTS